MGRSHQRILTERNPGFSTEKQRWFSANPEEEVQRKKLYWGGGPKYQWQVSTRHEWDQRGGASGLPVENQSSIESLDSDIGVYGLSSKIEPPGPKT